MKAIYLWTAAACLALTVTSCKKDKKDDTTTTPATNSVTLHFEHVWGPNEYAFNLNTDYVHPVTNDSLNFVTLKYYVSNVKFLRADGSQWIQSESYYLLDLATNPDGDLLISGVPQGEYVGVEYTLGVDSTRNVSGAQTGALSTTYGMFWSWNSGYIFSKIEGTSANNGNNAFSYHLGGFSGTYNILTVKNHSFTGGNLQVNASNSPEVHISVHPETIWNTIGSLSSAPTMIHMPGADAVTIANDFYGSFTFEHVHNN